MGSSLTLALNWLRPYVTSGVPASGFNKPLKTDGIATITDIDTRLTNLEPGGTGPLLLGFIGDSRLAGTNPYVMTGPPSGSPYVSPAATQTYVWNPTTNAFRDASILGQTPYDTTSNNNNIVRAISSQFKQQTGRPVYCVMYGVYGTTLYQWLDPTASHGNGNSTNYFGTFKTYATGALANSALASLGKTAFDAMIVVLGSNDGYAQPLEESPATSTFLSPKLLEITMMNQMIEQLRQPGIMPGTSPLVPILWAEAQHDIGNQSLQNNALLEVVDGTMSMSAISSVGATCDILDYTHEISAGMETLGITAWKAWKGLNTTYTVSDDLEHVIAWPGATAPGAVYPVGGLTPSAPWIPPSGFRKTRFTLRNGQPISVYVYLDPNQYRRGDVVAFSNESSGGGILTIVPAPGCLISNPSTPGFNLTGASDGSVQVLVYPGETIEYTMILGVNPNVSGEFELRSYSPMKQHYINCRASNNAAVSYSTGATLTGFVYTTRAGISLAAGTGVFTVAVPGQYLVTANIWFNNGNSGYVALQTAPAGTTTWTNVAVIANGNSGVSYGRNGSLSTILSLGAGDQFQLVALSSAININEQNGYINLAATRLAV